MDLQEKDLMVFNQIKECFKSGDEISISIIQRRFALGYNAAWRVFQHITKKSNSALDDTQRTKTEPE